MKRSFFGIGMTAVEVIAELVRSFPEIESIVLSVYTPGSSKKFDADRIDRHGPPEQLIDVSRQTVLAGDTENIFHPLVSAYTKSGDRHIAFSSEVKLRDSKENFFVPLIDFKCEDSPDNLGKIRSFLTKIGQRNGVILSSGQSYHYYGLELISAERWRIFMAKCLLSELRGLGLIDASHLGHSIWDGFSTLRISSSHNHPELPRVVSVLS